MKYVTGDIKGYMNSTQESLNVSLTNERISYKSKEDFFLFLMLFKRPPPPPISPPPPSHSSTFIRLHKWYNEK